MKYLIILLLLISCGKEEKFVSSTISCIDLGPGERICKKEVMGQSFCYHTDYSVSVSVDCSIYEVAVLEEEDWKNEGI